MGKDEQINNMPAMLRKVEVLGSADGNMSVDIKDNQNINII